MKVNLTLANIQMTSMDRAKVKDTDFESVKIIRLRKEFIAMHKVFERFSYWLALYICQLYQMDYYMPDPTFLSMVDIEESVQL